MTEWGHSSPGRENSKFNSPEDRAPLVGLWTIHRVSDWRGLNEAGWGRRGQRGAEGMGRESLAGHCKDVGFHSE